MHLVRFEHLSQPLAHRRVFLQRLGLNVLVALVVIAASLFGGMLIYREAAGMSWVDSFLNASMILSGEGPVDRLESDTAKILAGLYALYAGLLVIIITGLVLVPVFHRVLHGLHVPDEEDEEASEKRPRKPG
jgi:UPF0716 family protein affecting phage T7 exclusion